MFFLYSIILTFAFLVLLPRFLFDAIFNGKYASGFFERLGFLPKFDNSGPPGNMGSRRFGRRDQCRTPARRRPGKLNSPLIG